MTFSPNLYTLQPQGQPLNLTKYLEAELKAKKGKKGEKKEFAPSGDRTHNLWGVEPMSYVLLYRDIHI